MRLPIGLQYNFGEHWHLFFGENGTLEKYVVDHCQLLSGNTETLCLTFRKQGTMDPLGGPHLY